MDNPAAEFDAHDLQLIENARRESEASDAAALAAAEQAAELADLREFAPDAAAQLEALRAENERLRQVAEAAAPAPASPPFVPDQLVPEVQEAVDDIPELLQWQNDPDQRRWTAAKAADTMLRQSEGWANATFAQRFAKVTELVQQQFTTPSKAAPAPAPLEQALQRVAAAPPAATSAPLTVGDMRGGSSPSHNPTPDYHRMKEQGATDEDILAALPIMS
ncbi:hypothetical protein ABXN37_19875 [Piscinibacter sakaiensis]|uniref:hypothetical protein n=1 Tax=Piscinibacter sakaiensis TaxID=1547922 RepID=UPI00372BE13C